MAGTKVLMYGWEFPPHISGGLGVACYAIVKELAKKGTELTLVLPKVVMPTSIDQVNFVSCDDSTAALATEFAGIVDIKYPKITTFLYPYITAATSEHFFSDSALQEFLTLLDGMHLPEELKTMAKAAARAQYYHTGTGGKYGISLLTEVFRYALIAGVLAKDVDHEVIHAHDWLTMLAALEGKRYSHKPVILHVHALETDRSGLWVDKRIFAIEKYGMEQADRIIAVSQYTKNNIVQHYGIAPDKITVVYNGAYCNEYFADHSDNSKPKMVLFLGRITQQKGPYFFIEIARRVLAIRNDVQFVLAGTGDLLRDMIERTADLQIGKNVHFTGFLNREQVQKIYQLADVYVMPSVSEPFGLSALEALSYNVPLIISKQSGVAEVLRNALVSDFWDVEDMAAKILALLEYPVLRQVSLANARKELQAITWDHAADKIIDLYNKVVLR